jgi:hypothetical protein
LERGPVRPIGSNRSASPSTTILYPMRGGEIARIGADEVRQRYGVDPKQVPDFIALRGDPSDKNCPAPLESGQSAPLNCCDGTARLMGFLRPVSFKIRLKCSASIG